MLINGCRSFGIDLVEVVVVDVVGVIDRVSSDIEVCCIVFEIAGISIEVVDFGIEIARIGKDVVGIGIEVVRIGIEVVGIGIVVGSGGKIPIIGKETPVLVYFKSF